MRTIITFLFAFVILFQLPASAKDEKAATKKAVKTTGAKRYTGKRPVSAKKKTIKVQEIDRQVSTQVKNAILATGANITKLADKQMKVTGSVAKANSLVAYHSYLADTSLTANVNVLYENTKDFYTDKTTTKKYIVTIYGDQSNFVVKYTSHDKKCSVRYRYPDYSLKRKPTNAEMEKEIMNALAAINKKGKQKQLTLQNY